MKPLAKSLHTVTVLVRVALNTKRSRERAYPDNPPMANDHAVAIALEILGLANMPDTNGLAEQAIKQLNKFS